MNLFQLGPFELPDKRITHFKIECDVLLDRDWEALARLAVATLPPFGHVEGVPRGGLAFASALAPYVTEGCTQLLIADDVWVSGTSMIRHRGDREAIGVVAFTRPFKPLPLWVRTLFTMPELVEEATYRIGEETKDG